MLGIFPSAEAEQPPGSDRMSPAPSETNEAVLSQLEAVQRTQSQQTAVMRSLQSCISDMMQHSRTSSSEQEHSLEGSRSSTSSQLSATTEIAAVDKNMRATVGVPPSSPPSLPSRGQHRKESWTWDPQVQGDLEQSFELFRSMRRRKPKAGESPQNPRRVIGMLSRSKSTSAMSHATSSASPNSARRRRSRVVTTSPGASPETVSRRNVPEKPTLASAAAQAQLSHSRRSVRFSSRKTCTSGEMMTASSIISKWTQAKNWRNIKNSFTGSSNDLTRSVKSFIGAKDRETSRKRTIDRLARQPSSRILRSSWLFRQRVAGRLTRREARRQPCGMLFSQPLCKRLPLISPDSLIGIIFERLNALAVVYIATFTPLQVAFYENFDTVPWHLTNMAVEILFMLGIALRFRQSFVHDGILIKDAHFIALHYFRGEFLTDAIASFPYAWLHGVRIYPDPSSALPRAAGVRMLPMLRAVRIIVPVLRGAFKPANGTPSSSFLGLKINPGVTRALELMFFFLCTCHWIGCMWWAVGELEQDGLIGSSNSSAPRWDPESKDSWGPSPWLRETQHVTNQYAHALLWGASLMTGFVPFDVVPSTIMEVLVTALALLFGLIVNTIIISSTTSALQSISFKSSHVVDKMEQISLYMRHKRVPLELARKISAFYEYQLSPQRSGAGGHDLGELPPMLAMELIMHTHQDLFRECPIFHLIPPPTALSLVEHFEPVVYVPDEIVIHEGAPNAALFVINRGLVTVWKRDESMSNNKKIVTTLTDNDFFGEQTLLKSITSHQDATQPTQPIQANATCQCASYCDLFRLTSNDFMAVLDQARSRRGNWTQKSMPDMAEMLSDAAHERNARVDKQRARSLVWAAKQVQGKLRRENETPQKRMGSHTRSLA